MNASDGSLLLACFLDVGTGDQGARPPREISKTSRQSFFVQREQRDSELRVKVQQAADEKDALLQRAGIKDGPEDWLADDAERWSDEAYYRRRVREMVFPVSDPELRRQVMRGINGYRYAVYERWDMLRLFDEGFAARLRSERCRPPRLLIASSIGGPFAFLCLVYFLRGPLEARVVGISFLLPATALMVVTHIDTLYRHNATMREAIRRVERDAAISRREAERRLHLPEVFSRREMRTGEADHDCNRHGEQQQ